MAVPQPIHNPVPHMFDLRLALSHGRKRIGLLIGAGAPTALRANHSSHVACGDRPLIPDVAGLTKDVIDAATDEHRRTIDKLVKSLNASGVPVNVETILTRVRMLAQSIGEEEVHGLSGDGYEQLGTWICRRIGDCVQAELPPSPNPFSELVTWISGTYREHAVEIFTPNYDLLLEEAFERAQVPYFDGFSGAHRPFFDAASVLSEVVSPSSEQFPPRWSRIWKLHGSLGWSMSDGRVVRTGQREATELIYPEHLKYEQIRKLPYVALFERFYEFLTTPDTLLICTGFSFRDPHICAVLDESLAANGHTSVLAFQFETLDKELAAVELAQHRPNMSVYARNGAIINGIAGDWQLGELPNDDWQNIVKTFWRSDSADHAAEFMLGDFKNLARFLALARSSRLAPEQQDIPGLDAMDQGDLAAAGPHHA